MTKKIGNIKLNIFSRMLAWFANVSVKIGKLVITPVYKPIQIRDQTIIIMANAIQHVPDESVYHTLKGMVQSQATLAGVEPYLHKMIKKNIPPRVAIITKRKKPLPKSARKVD